jgi:hypothetical protein
LGIHAAGTEIGSIHCRSRDEAERRVQRGVAVRVGPIEMKRCAGCNDGGERLDARR